MDLGVAICQTNSHKTYYCTKRTKPTANEKQEQQPCVEDSPLDAKYENTSDQENQRGEYEEHEQSEKDIRNGDDFA